MIEAKLEGRDFLRIDDGKFQVDDLKFEACSELLELLKQQKAKFGGDLKQWQDPSGNAHSALLLREFLLKLKGQWKLPYEHLEICHCRAIPTDLVDQSVVAGAHTPEAVSRWTTASTACGTCKPDVERILAYRLK